MVGLGEPREVRAGVVGGSYFDVMGLHPVLGRLLDMRDDGPAAGAAVLTYRFWTTALKSDPSVLGKTVRLGTRARRPSWACWNRRCRIRRKPRSSPTW
jgi:putative ABC transport system permease protein